MSDKFNDLTIEDIETSIAVFEATQASKGLDLTFQIEELKKALEERKPKTELVLLKG